MSEKKNQDDAASGMKHTVGRYDPRSYDDQLERALVEESVSSIRTQPCTVVSPDASVERALRWLVGREIACLLVAEDERLVGIFTKRDVLDKVALRYDEVKGRPISDVMTRNPAYVYESEPVAAALCVMAGGGHRHVPVLDNDDKITGIVGPMRVTRFLTQYIQGN